METPKTMTEAHKAFMKAGWELYEAWKDDAEVIYPEYLPSFDEFLTDFSGLFVEQD